MTDFKIWYVRRKEQVRGPFSFTVLSKLAKLGRLKLTDEISSNKQEWTPVSCHIGLFPLDNDEIQLKDEERSGLDRRYKEGEAGKKESREGEDRRRPESKETLQRRKKRTLLLNAIRENRKEDRFPKVAIAISVVLLVIIGMVMTPSTDEQVIPDCEAQPQPGVNWDNCRFTNFEAKNTDLSESSIRNAALIHADLQAAILSRSNISYSDLNGANLSNVELDHAILKGADLRSANLRSASLRETDLSYADLRNADLQDADLTLAILDKAIWMDGKLCAKGSLGHCQ